jgi:hypothetical protein
MSITHKTSDHHPQNIRPSPTKHHQTILTFMMNRSDNIPWLSTTTLQDMCNSQFLMLHSHGSKWKSHESVIMLGAYSLAPKRHNLMHMIWTSCGNRLQAVHLNIHKLGNKETWSQPREDHGRQWW